MACSSAVVTGKAAQVLCRSWFSTERPEALLQMRSLPNCRCSQHIHQSRDDRGEECCWKRAGPCAQILAITFFFQKLNKLAFCTGEKNCQAFNYQASLLCYDNVSEQRMLHACQMLTSRAQVSAACTHLRARESIPSTALGSRAPVKHSSLGHSSEVKLHGSKAV